MIRASDLIASARKMLENTPTDSDLRRAASTAYYALFHELSLYFSTIALHPDGRSFTRAHLQAYRYIDHGSAKARCIEACASTRKFPVGVIEFAKAFVNLQERRLEADYDPSAHFEPAIVLSMIDDAERAIVALGAESIEDTRAFAIFVALRPKGRG